MARRISSFLAKTGHPVTVEELGCRAESNNRQPDVRLVGPLNQPGGTRGRREIVTPARHLNHPALPER